MMVQISDSNLCKWRPQGCYNEREEVTESPQEVAGVRDNLFASVRELGAAGGVIFTIVKIRHIAKHNIVTRECLNISRQNSNLYANKCTRMEEISRTH